MNTEEVADAATSPECASAIRPLPSIVRIVLTQAELHRMRGQITTETFNAQVQRLAREELEPRERSIFVCHLPGGTTRFTITAGASGRVCDVFEIAQDEPRSEDA